MRLLGLLGVVTANPFAELNVKEPISGLGKSLYFERNSEKCVVEAHNYYRELHGVPKLVWDDQLAADAQVHCDKMAASGNFEHATDLHSLSKGVLLQDILLLSFIGNPY